MKVTHAHAARPPAGPVSPWWGLAAVLLASCLLRSQVADIPLERDEGEYGYIAQRWAAGELPYQTSFNQKFPGAFLVYGVIGAVLGETPAAVHWGMQLWSMGTITLIFLLGRKLFSAPAGVAAAAFAALIVGDGTVLGNAANTEVFAILFFAASVLAAVTAVERGSVGWAVAAGALGAGGMTFKQPGVFNLVFVCGYVAWAAKRRVPQTAAAVAGAAAVLGLVCGYFAVRGAWADFYDNTIGHNFAYASRIPLRYYPLVFWENFAPILGSFWPVALLAVWGVVGPWVFGRFNPATAAANSQNPRLRANSVLAVAWLAFCSMAVSVGGYFREHYFIQAIPPAALLAGLGATLIRPAGKPAALVAYVLCGVAAAYAVYKSPWYYLPGSPDEKCRQLYGINPFPESVEIGRYVAEHTTPDDTVLVMGSEPQILYYAGRRSATRYILAYPLMTAFPDTEARQKVVMDEVRRNNPKIVVTVFVSTSFLEDDGAPRTIYRELREYMGDRYAVVGAVVPVRPPGGGPPEARFSADPRTADAYRVHPMWYDTTNWWTPVLVWQRMDSPNPPAP